MKINQLFLCICMIFIVNSNIYANEIFNKTGFYYGMLLTRNTNNELGNSGSIFSIGDNEGIEDIISTRFSIASTSLNKSSYFDLNICYGKALIKANSIVIGPYLGLSINYNFQDNKFNLGYTTGINIDYALSGKSLLFEEFGFLNLRIGYANLLLNQENKLYDGTFLISIGIEGLIGTYNSMPI